MIIAQISDMHVRQKGELSYDRVDTAPFLERAITEIRQLRPRPDVVVATGDLVDGGTLGEYAEVKRLLSPLAIPVYVIPGNHDDREALAAAFAAAGYLPRAAAHLQYVVDDHPVRLIGLDTLVPGQPHGDLCAERLAWLAERLAEVPDKPTILMMHHPPFRAGIGHMDSKGLVGCDALARILRQYKNVERILCGHLHRAIHARFAGTIASVAPSTAHQVVLDLRPEAPSDFVMEPPAYQLHVWWPETPLVTHTAYVGRFDGPYPFND